MKVYKYTNDRFNFHFKYSFPGYIDEAIKYFNDNNQDNYVMCYIYIDNYRTFKFDEDLYNNIHNQYLQYLIENPNTKIIICTNNKYGYNWCKNYLKFINSFVYYKSNNFYTNYYN